MEIRVGNKVEIVSLRGTDTGLGMEVGNVGEVLKVENALGIVDVLLDVDKLYESEFESSPDYNDDGSYSFFFDQVRVVEDIFNEDSDGGYFTKPVRRDMLIDSTFNQVLRYNESLQKEAIDMIIESLIEGAKYSAEVELKTRIREELL